MTHAVAERPGVQLAIDGLLPPPDSLRLRFSLLGHLQRPAEVRTSVDGLAHLVVTLAQPQGGLPFVAVWHAKTREASDDLHRLGRQMQRGLSVTVIGCGVVLGRCDDDADALLIQRCDAVQVPGVASFAHPSE